MGSRRNEARSFNFFLQDLPGSEASAQDRFLGDWPPCPPVSQEHCKQAQAQRDQDKYKYNTPSSPIASNHTADMMRIRNAVTILNVNSSFGSRCPKACEAHGRPSQPVRCTTRQHHPELTFVSVTEAVVTSLPAGDLVFQMIGAVAQFERSLIAERVRSGLANARAQGKVLGRPALRKLTLSEAVDLKRLRRQQNIPFRNLAEKFGVSVWTAH